MHAADRVQREGYRFKYSLALSSPGMGGGVCAECQSTPPARTPQLLKTFTGSFCCAGFDNDPSAGSPTETLLRLLLPLNDKVQWTSRNVAGSERLTSPRSKHFTGSFNRQIAPPTKNGHAPPPIESRKSSQSVNPYYVWTWVQREGYRFKYSLALSSPGMGGGVCAECQSTPPVRTPQLLKTFTGSFCCAGFDNDPSAGSPTETLLRLLLPLNDKVQWTSRDVAGSEPPTSPRSEHFTGSFNR
ncbi:hypothetical protein CQW23_33371 [Capsicum baccatum]|uniref:Uncharacterized protein n=1 Tax=Capsicum baccatum TaxID=33114 RepID=A0A2G2V1Y5_CAPBA|nr:hypothetical protein CQW23_33371 [Capsicum baccatum]